MTKQEMKPAIPIAVPVFKSSLLPYTSCNIAGNRKKVLKKLEIEYGRINTLVESMKCSSPTQIKSMLALSPQEVQNSWTLLHPSALSRFDQIANTCKGKKIVVFLDYDGTLSPIVQDPDRAFMSDEMREAVRDVAKYFPTAIVTGRCIEKVYSFVRLDELYYAGSHGMDIKGPVTGSKREKDDKDMLFQPASEYLPMIKEVYKAMQQKMMSIPGAKVEDNHFCISVHFRCVDQERWGLLAEEVKSVLQDYPMLKLTNGRMVLEIRPSIEWDKGKAIEFLLESLGFSNSKEVFPVYIGDDRTDEDAFKVLHNRGQGLGILVTRTPKETSASYTLQDPSEVMGFLYHLVEWRKLSLGG